MGNGTDALEIALEALDMPPGSDRIDNVRDLIRVGRAHTTAMRALQGIVKDLAGVPDGE